MRTAVEIIKDYIGISVHAGDMTPMDYGECKKCIETAQDELLKEIEDLKKERDELK